MVFCPLFWLPKGEGGLPKGVLLGEEGDGGHGHGGYMVMKVQPPGVMLLPEEMGAVEG